MGNLATSLRTAIWGLFERFSDRPAKILMLGLDAAGKTTVLYRLKLNKVVDTVPTIGFTVETLTPVKNISFTVWDIGGQDKIRPLWRHYFVGTHGLMFVVDSADANRLDEAREELGWLLNSDELIGVPLVVLANKQDLSGALSPSVTAAKLDLQSVKGRNWYVQGTNALNGDGLYEAIEEMSQLVKEFQATRAM
ncbi:hypothetical protein EMCRGX_G018168 [Ephydatia muelleri]